jgi:hypothetical protein
MKKAAELLFKIILKMPFLRNVIKLITFRNFIKNLSSYSNSFKSNTDQI